VGGRYRVLDQLGRGGMACVYRAHDITTQRTIALKRLVVPLDEAKRRAFITLFEREYHTLAQLAHPRVVEVYDCGLDDAGPYYTMELLDRGDLRDRSPMPWHTACELAFDVCSALALVHSRRLVHRDLSPRNVRFTHTNNAKLIDFGALAPIGPNNQVVGTPSFIAPEALHGGTLDARTDLYSLGATLYFTLTGYAPYPAGDIADLTAAWGFRPTPPSGTRRVDHGVVEPRSHGAPTERVRSHAAFGIDRGSRSQRTAERLTRVFDHTDARRA
jgi:serine/threonine-protein kinase